MLHLHLQSHQLPHRGVVLHACELALVPGELTVVVGPNGAGKSTLLQLLSGWKQPSKGEVHWGSQALSTFSAAQLAGVRTYLPQDATHFISALTVREIVELGARGQPASIDQALAWMGLSDYVHRRYTDLSGGEQQRVHLARCRVQQECSIVPAWSIFDEPLQSLDPFYQHSVLDFLRAWAKKHAGTVVVSLHQLNLAAQYADTIVVLHEGYVVSQGIPSVALLPELLERVYGICFEWVLHANGEFSVLIENIKNVPLAST